MLSCLKDNLKQEASGEVRYDALRTTDDILIPLLKGCMMCSHTDNVSRTEAEDCILERIFADI